MATVRAFSVQTPHATSLVLSATRATAIDRHLFAVEKINRRAHRQFAAPSARATECDAWEAMRPDGSTVAFFADDVGMATAIASMSDAVERLTGCDPLMALLDMSDSELLFQARNVWSRGQLKARMPSIWQRIQNPTRYKSSNMTPSNRLLVAYGLRLAFDHPWIGVTDPGLLGQPEPKSARQLAVERHADSIPMAVIREMADCNPQPEVSGLDVRRCDALIRLVEAYGEDPAAVTAGEAAALWEGGPEALARARLDVRHRRGNTLAAWQRRIQLSSTRSKRSSAERGTRP